MEVFKTYKQRGEWIELLFMARGAKRGYVLLKPWETPPGTTSGSTMAGESSGCR